MLDVDTSALAAAAGRLVTVADEADALAGWLAGTNWWPAPPAGQVLAFGSVNHGALHAWPVSATCTLLAVQARWLAARLQLAADVYAAADAAAEAAVAAAHEVAQFVADTTIGIALAALRTAELVAAFAAAQARVAIEVTAAVGAAAVEVAAQAAATLVTWLALKVLPAVLLSPAGAGLIGWLVLASAAGLTLAQAIADAWWGARGETAPQLADVVFEHVNWQPLVRLAVDTAGLVPFLPVPPAFLVGVEPDGAAITAGATYQFLVWTGLLKPGVFTVTSQTHTRPLAAVAQPPTVGDLVAQVPPSVDGGPQVVVTTYERDGSAPRYAIAIAGTSSQGFGGGDDEAWNMQGNLAGYGGSTAESVAAALSAIEAAGVPEGATIVLTGYSQGAIIAQAIAASGRYDVQFLTTVGTPTRPTEVPDDVTVLEIEHPGDPIVGLQGTRPSHVDGATVVVTDPVPGSADPAEGGMLAQHSQDAYTASAQQLATSDDPAVQAAQQQLADLFEGYVETSTQHLTTERADAAEAPEGSLPWWHDRVGPQGGPLTPPVEELHEGASDVADFVAQLAETLDDLVPAAGERGR